MMNIIKTDHLILRPFRDNDFNDLYEYLSDPVAVQYEPYQPMNQEEVLESLKWRISTDEMIAVELMSESKLIGNIYLGQRDDNTIELGYVFNLKYARKGYAYQACQTLIQEAFHRGIQRILAECDPENIASWKLLEKLGFKKEAHLIKNIFFWKDEQGLPIWKDTYIYSLINID